MSVSWNAGCTSPHVDVTPSDCMNDTWFSVVGRLEKARRVVERHRLDVERAQDGLLVDEVRIVGVGVARRQNDAHFAHVDVHRSQVGSV